MWLKKKDIAKYLGVSTRSIGKYVQEYGLEYVKLPSGLTMYSTEAADEFYGRFSSKQRAKVVDNIIQEVISK